MNPRYYRSEQYYCQMNELMFQAGVRGMSERSELTPCIWVIPGQINTKNGATSQILVKLGENIHYHKLLFDIKFEASMLYGFIDT